MRQFFYIFGNACSIGGLIGTCFQIICPNVLPITAVYIFLSVLLLTIAFWIYSAVTPNLKNAIDDRTNFTGKYRSSKGNIIDIIEGEFKVDISTWGAVISLPPFETAPKIDISSVNAKSLNSPAIDVVTNHSFKVSINSSEQSGTWKYRATGKLLKSVE